MTTRRLNGATVRALLSALGISQANLATRIYKDTSYVSRIISGAKNPSDATTRAIADVLGVPLDAITYVIPACSRECCIADTASAA